MVIKYIPNASAARPLAIMSTSKDLYVYHKLPKLRAKKKYQWWRENVSFMMPTRLWQYCEGQVPRPTTSGSYSSTSSFGSRPSTANSVPRASTWPFGRSVASEDEWLKYDRAAKANIWNCCSEQIRSLHLLDLADEHYTSHDLLKRLDEKFSPKSFDDESNEVPWYAKAAKSTWSFSYGDEEDEGTTDDSGAATSMLARMEAKYGFGTPTYGDGGYLTPPEPVDGTWIVPGAPPNSP